MLFLGFILQFRAPRKNITESSYPSLLLRSRLLHLLLGRQREASILSPEEDVDLLIKHQTFDCLGSQPWGRGERRAGPFATKKSQTRQKKKRSLHSLFYCVFSIDQCCFKRAVTRRTEQRENFLIFPRSI